MAHKKIGGKEPAGVKQINLKKKIEYKIGSNWPFQRQFEVDEAVRTRMNENRKSDQV